MQTIVMIDHGVGNLRSVEKAIEAVGGNIVLSKDRKVILNADKIVLPGVGAFGDCMRGVREFDLVETVLEVAKEKPLLGICVGMQMFFEEGLELGTHAGLGLLPGNVTKFDITGHKVPHTGWNQLDPVRDNPLLHNLPADRYAYFNHSYVCRPSNPDHALATTNYGGDFCSVVQVDNLYGVQFHPEKSQHVGLKILQNFVENC